jgi:4-carboxymuconolactone decarboxylase
MTNKRPRSEKVEKGLETRTAVLGAGYVEQSLNNADDFSWYRQLPNCT